MRPEGPRPQGYKCIPIGVGVISGKGLGNTNGVHFRLQPGPSHHALTLQTGDHTLRTVRTSRASASAAHGESRWAPQVLSGSLPGQPFTLSDGMLLLAIHPSSVYHRLITAQGAGRIVSKLGSVFSRSSQSGRGNAGKEESYY